MAIITVLFARIVIDSSRQSVYTKKRLEGNASAATIMSIMANDITNMVRRPDVEIQIVKNKGNDEIYFLSKTPGIIESGIKPEDLSGMTLIGYRISSIENSPTLSGSQLNRIQRLAHPVTWAELQGGLLPNRIAALLSQAKTEEWQVLGNAFRFELAFSLTDARTLSDLPTQSYSYLKASDTEPIGYTQGTLQDIKSPGLLRSIQVGMVYLDEANRQICTEGTIKAWIDSFDDAANNGKFADWEKQLGQISTGPKQAREAMRIYQPVFTTPCF